MHLNKKPFLPSIAFSSATNKNEAKKMNNTKAFRYMMLGRLQMDCEYFLGHGNRLVKHLWAGNVEGQIQEMKNIWNSFSEDEKPEWLTMQQIENYETRMKNDAK